MYHSLFNLSYEDVGASQYSSSFLTQHPYFRRFKQEISRKMEGVVRKGVWVVPGVGGGVSSIGGLGCGGLSDSYGDPGGGDIFSIGGDSDGIPCEGVIGGGETEEVTAAA